MADNCGGCGAAETASLKLFACSGCKHTRYCNRSCQQQDWRSHKADCKIVRAAALATAATAVNKTLSESFPGYAQNQFNNETKRQPELELLSTIEEIDQMAIRDWLHRGGFDPASSFDTLWRFPTAPGSQAGLKSPPCQCNQQVCQSKDTSGICIHDPVVCWACHSFFSARCVPGFDKIYQGGSNKTTLFSWGACPLCKVEFGAAALPTTFLIGIGYTELGVSITEVHSTSGIVKCLCAEIDHCVKRARQLRKNLALADQAASFCTRAINICNMLRSMDASHFTLGVADHYFFAQYTRAKIEGNAKVYKAIRASVSNFAKEGGYLLRGIGGSGGAESAKHMSGSIEEFERIFLDADAFAAAGLKLASGAHVFDGRRGQSSHGQSTRGLILQPWPDNDPQFHQLDGEYRGMMNTVPGAPMKKVQRSLAANIVDYRWKFRTKSDSKEYFTTLVRCRSEDTKSAPEMSRLTRTLATVDTADESVILRGGVAHMKLETFNVLLRAGRVCMKLYVGVMFGSSDSMRAVQALAATAVARIRESLENDVLASTKQPEDASWMGSEWLDYESADEERAAPYPPAGFSVGLRVALCGLTGSTELNGKQATVVGTAASGRLLVRFEGGEERAVKTENLKVV